MQAFPKGYIYPKQVSLLNPIKALHGLTMPAKKQLWDYAAPVIPVPHSTGWFPALDKAGAAGWNPA